MEFLARIGKIAVGLVVAASFGVWVYAYSGAADREAPDTLANDSFARLAEPRCARAMADLEALPNALEARDNVDRSAQLEERNDVLVVMTDDLEAFLDAPEVTLNERDEGITREWIADWRTYIGNRANYTEALADDPNALFTVAAVGGERLERRITRFANTNELFSCATPADVG